MTADDSPLDPTVQATEQGGMSIEPAADAGYDLDAMVTRMRDDQLHDLEDWGPPVGAETW